MKAGFLPILAILFIGLKLGGVITWSWLWVLSPLWIPAAIAILLWLFLFTLFLFGQGVFDKKKPKR